MGGGNGAKAAQKRARNQAKQQQANKAVSQLKSNAAAMNIICSICKQTFLSTSRAPQLTLHAENKHNSTLAQCFPNWQDPGK